MIEFKNIFDVIIIHMIFTKIEAAEFENINFYNYISYNRANDSYDLHKN